MQKQGFVDHKTPDDYPLDKSKIIDHRKGVDDNRWTREKTIFRGRRFIIWTTRRSIKLPS